MLHVFFLQAYTVELEAELNQLKEDNALLKQALVNTISRLTCNFLVHESLLRIILHLILDSKQAEAEFERKQKQQVILISTVLQCIYFLQNPGCIALLKATLIPRRTFPSLYGKLKKQV